MLGNQILKRGVVWNHRRRLKALELLRLFPTQGHLCPLTAQRHCSPPAPRAPPPGLPLVFAPSLLQPVRPPPTLFPQTVGL